MLAFFWLFFEGKLFGNNSCYCFDLCYFLGWVVGEFLFHGQYRSHIGWDSFSWFFDTILHFSKLALGKAYFLYLNLKFEILLFQVSCLLFHEFFAAKLFSAKLLTSSSESLLLEFWFSLFQFLWSLAFFQFSVPFYLLDSLISLKHF